MSHCRLYRDEWHIYFDPPPIPSRKFDWHFYHDDYDGPGDNRHGDGASRRDCEEQIDELIAEEEAA